MRKVMTEDYKSLSGMGRVDRESMFTLSTCTRITGHKVKPEIASPKQARGGGSSPSV